MKLVVETESYLPIFLCIGACEQRVEDNDGLIQIPHKHPLQKKKREISQKQFPTVLTSAFSCFLLYIEATESRLKENQKECQKPAEI